MSEEHKTLWPANECFVCVFADMPIFGQCPAQDDFYLVMCSHCSQVVKPQAFQAHYGKNTTADSFSHFTLPGLFNGGILEKSYLTQGN